MCRFDATGATIRLRRRGDINFAAGGGNDNDDNARRERSIAAAGRTISRRPARGIEPAIKVMLSDSDSGLSMPGRDAFTDFRYIIFCS